jgi:hypothetical protein
MSGAPDRSTVERAVPSPWGLEHLPGAGKDRSESGLADEGWPGAAPAKIAVTVEQALRYWWDAGLTVVRGRRRNASPQLWRIEATRGITPIRWNVDGDLDEWAGMHVSGQLLDRGAD